MFDIVLNMLSVLVKYNWTLSKLINLQKLELYTITTQKVHTKKNFARFDVFEEYSKVCKMGKMFFLSIIACMKLNALQEVLMSKDNTRWDIRIKGARN